MMPTPTNSTPPRGQRSQYACDECRRRKLRCDGRQPQCSICLGAGTVCEITQRGLRGPKKGYVKALKNRVSQLEGLLEGRIGAAQLQNKEAGHDSPQSRQEKQRDIQQKTNFVGTKHASGHDGMMMPTPPVESTYITSTDVTTIDFSHVDLQDVRFSPPSGILAPGSNHVLGMASLLGDKHIPLGSALSSDVDTQLHVDAIVQGELDQLYFDRVHPSIPILHQRRYLSWSKSRTKNTTRKGLQYAMWTLAALLSAQHRDIVDSLYSSAKYLLQTHGVDDNVTDGTETELIQAWVLLAMCESMKVRYRESWMSAGRAIRIIQGLRFHELDSPRDLMEQRLVADPAPSSSEDFIGTEQKRRVFWMAYFLDHLLCIRNDWPVTLNEHVICTRLPIPDADFQNGQDIVGDFLSEAITKPNPRIRAPFNECLVFVTICGRVLLRGQQRKISRTYGDTSLDTAEQRSWLDSILTTRLQVLAQYYPSQDEAYESMLLFAHVLAPATVVYFCNGMMDSLANRGGLMPDEQALDYQERALEATTTIIRLTKALSEQHFSKVHPLMPMPLFMCAEFLYTRHSKGEAFSLSLQELANAMSLLKNVNNLDQSYLDLLPKSCVGKLPALTF